MTATEKFRAQVRALAAMLTLAAMASVALSAPARAQVEFRWKYTEGERLTQTVVQETTMNMLVMDQVVSNKSRQTFSMEWLVKSVDDEGNGTVELRIGRIQLKIDMTGMSLEFDTAAEEKPAGQAAMLADVLGKLVGIHYIVEMSPRGEVLSVELPEATKKAFQQIPGVEQMFGNLNADGIKQMMGQANLLPAGPVAVGDTWRAEDEQDVPLFGRKKSSVDFTYEGTEEREEGTFDKISYEVHMNFGEAAPAGFPGKIEVRNEQFRGVIFFDRQKGRMHDSQMDFSMDMLMNINGQEAEQQVAGAVYITLAPTVGSPGAEPSAGDE